ncbi:MAG TPA: ABC transporter ATP-binding protein [Burkholderiales bacterium]|nr:ABC transporter ATP-binding protein [Burkholderiales bacterium]
MRAHALDIIGVRKNFGKYTALNEISFSVESGEYFALVGINGAGKTTLLKCLLDFCETDAGAINIFGTSHRVTAARKRLSFLPERFIPPFYLTGRDFLHYMLRLQGIAYDPNQVEGMLSALDLDLAALRLPVRAYSKGMTQKLGLAACFLASKELYVLDEPTSGLDPKARARLKTKFNELRDKGRTLFLTSHTLADVEEICDRMAVIHDGRVLFVGTPQQLCRAHAAPTLERAFLSCIGEPGAMAGT